MKLVFSIAALLALNLHAFAADEIIYEYPKDPEQERRERRSGAYQKALMQSVIQKEFVDCYYRMSGCSEEQQNRPSYWPAKQYPARQYPKEGYVLDTDGTYKFKPGAQSRK